MNTYAILRRNGWQTPEDLEAAALRSKRVSDEEMHDCVSWIRSYAVVEEDGSLGFVCIYLASDADALRRHADAADLPIGEILPVVDTVLVRTDPALASVPATSSLQE